MSLSVLHFVLLGRAAPPPVLASFSLAPGISTSPPNLQLLHEGLASHYCLPPSSFLQSEPDLEKGLEMRKWVLSGILASEETYLGHLEALLLVRASVCVWGGGVYPPAKLKMGLGRDNQVSPSPRGTTWAATEKSLPPGLRSAVREPSEGLAFLLLPISSWPKPWLATVLWAGVAALLWGGPSGLSPKTAGFPKGGCPGRCPLGREGSRLCVSHLLAHEAFEGGCHHLPASADQPAD